MSYREALIPLTGSDRRKTRILYDMKKGLMADTTISEIVLYAKKDFTVRKEIFGHDLGTDKIQKGEVFSFVYGERDGVVSLMNKFSGREFESYYDPFLKGLLNEKGYFSAGDKIEGEYFTLYRMKRNLIGNYILPTFDESRQKREAKILRQDFPQDFLDDFTETLLDDLENGRGAINQKEKLTEIEPLRIYGETAEGYIVKPQNGENGQTIRIEIPKKECKIKAEGESGRFVVATTEIYANRVNLYKNNPTAYEKVFPVRGR